ncbi:MAG: type II toxin-antitoxin system Phd/YefM family antitoxin [Oscillospiraceae bacterium]|jgi:PHD/YefM family antitoxin component YafN of YafNO toxin-antitoxin module|nr:type II toxin-antitoxin system Phd/YefM family antitoxin [Oscillospiraceae bacterium]
MNFYTESELCSNSKTILESLPSEREIVITRDGKPAAVMIPVTGADFQETMNALRSARAMKAIKRMQKHSVENGLDNMTEEEIDAEITAARAQCKPK